MDAVLVELGPAGTPCWLSSAWRRPSLPYGYEQSAPTRGGRLTPRRHASGPGAGREGGREREEGKERPGSGPGGAAACLPCTAGRPRLGGVVRSRAGTSSTMHRDGGRAAAGRPGALSP